MVKSKGGDAQLRGLMQLAWLLALVTVSLATGCERQKRYVIREVRDERIHKVSHIRIDIDEGRECVTDPIEVPGTYDTLVGNQMIVYCSEISTPAGKAHYEEGETYESK
jgi:hypothetical protein